MGKPYYDQDGITIYHGDCREILPGLAGCSASAVLTDPPYTDATQRNARSSAVSASAGGRAICGSLSAFEATTEGDLWPVLSECGRVSASWVVANMDHRHALRLESDPPAGLRLLRLAVWVKTNGMPSLNGDRPAMGWEMFACLHRDDRKPAWLGGGKAINHIGPLSQRGGHPTQKPLVMVRQWARLFAAPGSTVLDPFMGSGTTLVAAKLEGRKAIGIEIEERYCEIAANRLAQGVLPFGESDA